MDPSKIFPIVVQVLVLLFAVSFHESAHAYIALRFGDTTARDLGRISLNPLRHLDPIGSVLLPLILALAGGPIFGWAKPTPVLVRNMRDARAGMFWVSAAGPISNLILAAVGLLASFACRPLYEFGGEPLLLTLFAWVIVNTSLAFFNLLPIPPLDGAGVLERFLSPEAGQQLRNVGRFGFMILLAMSWIRLPNGRSVLDLIFQPIHAVTIWLFRFAVTGFTS